jgi:uncharacterized protein YjbJ (UPF0337 family)
MKLSHAYIYAYAQREDRSALRLLLLELLMGKLDMNKDKFEGKWKQTQGEAEPWWGILTYADLDWAAGKFDALVSLLQEKYGYTHQKAADEIDRLMTEHENSLKTKSEPQPNNRSGFTIPSNQEEA